MKYKFCLESSLIRKNGGEFSHLLVGNFLDPDTHIEELHLIFQQTTSEYQVDLPNLLDRIQRQVNGTVDLLVLDLQGLSHEVPGYSVFFSGENPPSSLIFSKIKIKSSCSICIDQVDPRLWSRAYFEFESSFKLYWHESGYFRKASQNFLECMLEADCRKRRRKKRI